MEEKIIINEEQRLKDVAAIVRAIDLEEMDWQASKKQAKANMRAALLDYELNGLIMTKSELKLRAIWDTLPKAEQDKRYAEYKDQKAEDLDSASSVEPLPQPEISVKNESNN